MMPFVAHAQLAELTSQTSINYHHHAPRFASDAHSFSHTLEHALHDQSLEDNHI